MQTVNVCKCGECMGVFLVRTKRDTAETVGLTLK